MNEPGAPPATIAYAQPTDDGVVSQLLRPYELLAPNLLALAVIFLRLTSSESPFDVLVQYVGEFRRSGIRTGHLWDAMITAPFLLALPLAGWTLRLTISPRPSRAERGAAWGITCSSAALTAVVVGYCARELSLHSRFVPAFVMTVIILALGGIAVWSLRRLMWTWAPALLAMTAAFAANTAMTVLVIVSHANWTPGLVVAAVVMVLQLVAGTILHFRWRRELPPG